MKDMQRYGFAAMLGAAALVVCVEAAKADFIVPLAVPNAALADFTGPYARLDVHLVDSTHATVTFDSLTNAGNVYLMGDGGTVALNVNATNFTLGSLSGANSGVGFTAGPLSDGGAGNEDGFGSFNLTINSFDGFTHSLSEVTFSLTNNSGVWGSAANVLAENDKSNFAAAHIFVTPSPANAADSALVGGFAALPAGGFPSLAPADIVEPGSLALLAAALLSSTLLRRSRV
jgi:hypothetical protein